MVNVKELIKNSLILSVQNLIPAFDEEISVEIPNNKAYGDFSTNIALRLAKSLKKNPIEIANSLKSELKNLEEFKRIEVVSPGFLNFYLDENIVFYKILENAKNKEFYPNNIERKKVIIEHTSVNPNKAMHVGHLRNSVLGDVLTNLYKKLGYIVEIQNYIDDTGLQVADTTNAILNLSTKQLEGQSFDDYCWDVYTEINKAYETNTQLLEERKRISKLIEEGDNDIAEMSGDIVNKIVDCHLSLMSEFDIYYDLLVYESDIIKFGFWEQAFSQLKESPNFFLETEGKQAGCWVLKYNSSKFGNKIFVRSNGTKVYTAKDTAYQMWKFGLLKKDFKYKSWIRTFSNKEVFKTDTSGNNSNKFGKGDIVINLIDERQTYPQEMVKHALQSLGYTDQYDNYIHLPYGVVTLSPNTAKQIGIDISDNKSSYAMSGRKGIGVRVTQLLSLMVDNIEQSRKESLSQNNLSKYIAIGALKHYMLKYNPLSEITFDYQEALRISGNTGPYLQYSFARATSILDKSEEKQFKVENNNVNMNDSERELISLIGQWYDVLNYASTSHSVSQIADYAFKLSSSFHSFYEKNNVLKEVESVKKFRLLIIKAYVNVINEVLDVLGIKALSKM